ncbi:hypothetical protein [Chryseobacterium herbae]|uniref:Phage major capsid protein E n=1 Tax=Chryseobacterium herbae TaxID=2976476 RepID=A0ABT2IYQ0_9FLAO|nr:hypothetical protein [Chryseobacterium sp. pc1-10]MCT2563955.1 hypothetical protein [Chryseobacterium sp. pc1-10]
MKRRLSLTALAINFILAFAFSFVASPMLGVNPFLLTAGIVITHAVVTYFKPMQVGILQEGLQKEVWIADIKENPIPDMSFINQSVDMSAFVENDALNLAEAGVEPDVHEDYFATNSGELPIQAIDDIPHRVLLKDYSTNQTRHSKLADMELAYNKRASVINRHRNAIAKNMAQRTAHGWGASTNDAFNKILNLGPTDSVIDGLIDMQRFFRDLDLDMSKMNIVLNSDHGSRIEKENKKLYKEITAEKGAELYDFKIFFYSKTPFYTDAGVKKPWGSTIAGTDKKSSIIWNSDEVFRCFGSTDMFATLGHSGWQADLISFAQRALTGKIRANNPKYLGTIL